MKWINLFMVITLFTLLSSALLVAEPEKLTDEQMTDVKVQQGIKNLDGAENTDAEDEILQNLSTPLPGTELENNNNNPNTNMTQIELDNLNNQQNQQNIQEQFSQQLFDQVIENQQ